MYSYWHFHTSLPLAYMLLPTFVAVGWGAEMPDAAAMSVIVGLVGLGLTVIWLVRSERQKKELMHVGKLADTISRERETNAELERQKLLQRQHEQQYRETRDFFKMMGWLWERFSEEDEYDEGDY